MEAARWVSTLPPVANQGGRRQKLGLGFRVWCLGFRVSGFGFRVSGFKCRVSGLAFGVEGFGLRVFRAEGRV